MSLFSLEQLEAWVATLDPAWLLVAAFGSALGEGIFPPFPGDTLLIGCLLVAGDDWGGQLRVALAALVGSVGGMGIDYAVGRLLHRQDRWPAWLDRHISAPRRHDFLAAYRRWGAWWILGSRFLPVARAVFFLLAGWAGLPPGRSLLLGTVSSAAWMALLLGGARGLRVGLHQLQDDVARWSVWGSAVVVVLLTLAWLLGRRRRR